MYFRKKGVTIALLLFCALNAGNIFGGKVKHSEKQIDAIFLGTSAGNDWPTFNGTYGEQHFSALNEINAKNISKLGLAWYMDLDAGNTVTGPIEVGNTVYISVGYSVVHAIDAVSGKLLWKYDSNVAKYAGIRLRQGWGSRGLAWWNNKIYVGTIDGRLIALDAKTGDEVWVVNTLKEITGGSYYVTGAPRVFDGKVIIGNGGTEHASTRGFVTTYDAETGKQLWRFYIVPGNPKDGFENKAMEMAAETWHGEWWKYGGGGNAWNAFTYDAEFDQILIGTGNGSPWNIKVRSQGKGDNLFLCSVVALDAKTGEYRWHYQINPGETWDYNASMDMQLGEAEIDGKQRKIVVTAPKNGFFYVIDRTNGKLISAEKIAKANWANHIDLETGRPVENPEARYPNGTFTLYPSSAGAHSWLPMSFDDENNRVFIPVMELGARYDDRMVDIKNWKHLPGNGFDVAVVMELHYDRNRKLTDPMSKLLAWDVIKQKEIWSVPGPGSWNGGVLATRGDVVFQGQITGEFKAYDAENGKLLWSFDAGDPVLAPPITYMADGKQYVTVLTGLGTSISAYGQSLGALPDYKTMKRRVLTFALHGNSELPSETIATAMLEEIEELGESISHFIHGDGDQLAISQPIKAVENTRIAFPDPDYKTADKKTLETAKLVFINRCMACHGDNAVAVGQAPDLRTSWIVPVEPAFISFLRVGSKERGMPSFEEVPEEQLLLIREYIRSEAAKLREKKNDISINTTDYQK